MAALKKNSVWKQLRAVNQGHVTNCRPVHTLIRDTVYWTARIPGRNEWPDGENE